MIKKTLLGIVTMLFISFALLYIEEASSNVCSGINTFTNYNFEWITTPINWIVFSILFLMISFVLFFEFFHSKINVIIYFSIISLIILSPIFKTIIENIYDSEKIINQEICGKINDDGMLFTATKLTEEEYLFLNKNNYLPGIPIKAKEINIEYFRDGFVGDVDLYVHIIPTNEKIENFDSLNTNWVIENKNNKLELVYHLYVN